MQLVTLDFETYYDSEYSLSKMSTEEYVNDPRFEIIGVGIKQGKHTTAWHPTHEGAIAAVRDIDWHAHALLAHNTMFDALIGRVHCEITPRMYLDTMSMAKAVLRPFTGSVGLAKMAAYLGIGQKGHEVIAAKGKRLVNFQADELWRYGEYCRNDVELTYEAFKRMMITFPPDELLVIDRTLRMYLEPVLELDEQMLANHLEEIQTRKFYLLQNLPNGVTKDDLMSNPKFAEVLKGLGVTPPMKESPTTFEPTLAFAKTDPEFMALCEHEDDRVQAVMAARLGTKSTLAETRTSRMVDIARQFRLLRVPLSYYGAHTGRWSGTENINLQNLPRKSDLRRAIMAPPGHELVVADFKQIEARVLAWAAGEGNLLEAFLVGEDVYTQFASVLYGKNHEDITEQERFIGKTCVLGLGYGMGAVKFGSTLASKGIEWQHMEVERAVQTYRAYYGKVQQLWKTFDRALIYAARATEYTSNFLNTPITVGPQSFLKPNGIPIVYQHLQSTAAGDWSYKAGSQWKKIYGAKACENWDQGVSRCIMAEAALRISYPMVLTVHDELVFCVPKNQLDTALVEIETEMVKQPEWALPFGHIPLAVEISHAERYGDAK
jgi:DNA polymerase